MRLIEVKWNLSRYGTLEFTIARKKKIGWLPVNMLSLTMQVPESKTESQCIVQPDDGMMIMSPGTRSSVLTVSKAPPPRQTSIMSLPRTVFLSFF